MGCLWDDPVSVRVLKNGVVWPNQCGSSGISSEQVPVRRANELAQDEPIGVAANGAGIPGIIKDDRTPQILL